MICVSVLTLRKLPMPVPAGKKFKLTVLASFSLNVSAVRTVTSKTLRFRRPQPLVISTASSVVKPWPTQVTTASVALVTTVVFFGEAYAVARKNVVPVGTDAMMFGLSLV